MPEPDKIYMFEDGQSQPKAEPNAEENLKQLWTTLKDDRYDMPSFTKFKRDMSKEENVERLHSNLKNAYNLPSQDQFKEDLGAKKKSSYQETKERVNKAVGAGETAPDREQIGEGIEVGGEPDNDVKKDISTALNEGELKSKVENQVELDYGDELTPPEKLDEFETTVRNIQSEYRQQFEETQQEVKSQYESILQKKADQLGVSKSAENVSRNKLEQWQEVKDRISKQYREELQYNKDKLLEKQKQEAKDIAQDMGLKVVDDGSVRVSEEELNKYQKVFKQKFDSLVDEKRQSKDQDSYGRDVLERIAASSERLVNNLPSNLAAIFERMHNATMGAIDKEEWQTQYWQKLAQDRQEKTAKLRQDSERYNKNITQLIGDGEIGKAIGETGLQIAEQVPQLMTFIGAGAAGKATEGLAAVATSVGANDYVDTVDEDIKESSRIMNALTSSLSEFTFEKLTTLPILKSLRINASQVGDDLIEREMKKFFEGTLNKSARRIMKGVTPAIQEASGEVATELTQQWSDAAAGRIEPGEIGRGLGDVAITSAIIGGSLGAVGGALNQDSKGEAKQYLKNVYGSLPQDMDVGSKIEAMDLIVKRDRLVDQRDKTSEGLKEGFNKQIKNIDQQLENITENYFQETGQAPKETEQATQQETTQEPGVNVQVTEEQDKLYQVGEQQFDTKDEFLQEVEKYKGQQDTPQITVRNDQQTADQATNILKEGLEQPQNPTINLQSEEGVSYKIGDQTFDNRNEFIEEVEKYKGQPNVPEITINNDRQTAQEVQGMLREGLRDIEQGQRPGDVELNDQIQEKEQEIQQEFESLDRQLDKLEEGENPQDVGKKFAKIQNEVSEEQAKQFRDKLLKKQKQFRKTQEAIDLEKEQVINYDQQTESQIEEDIIDTDQVNPETTIENNQESENPNDSDPIIQAQNSFIEIDVSKSKLQDWHRKYLSARGYIPKEVFDKWVETQSKTKVQISQIERRRREFNKALKETYGKTKLGTPKVSETELKKLNKALGMLGKDPQRRERVLKRVPTRLREPLVDMRNDIDQLTQKMTEEGLVEGNLAAKLTENMGFYLTRSYKAHNDPKWTLDNVPEEIKNRAINYLRKQFPDKTESQIDGILRRFLYKQNMPLAVMNQGKLGSKDLGILKKRTLENQAMRDLLGEYKDPMYNYATSITRMAELINRHKFLEFVRQNGEGQFLFKEPQGDFYAPIAAEGSKTMEPLNGWHTTPEIAQAFAEFNNNEDMSALGRFYIKFNTAVKYGKTILSPMTHVRNFTANFLFHVANGRSPIDTKAGPLGTLVQDIAKKNKKQWQEYWDRAMELGVVYESVWRGEIHDNIKDATKYHEEFVKYGDNLFQKTKTKGLRAIEKAYRKEDDAHKLFAWEGETRRYEEVYKKKNPDKSNDEIRKMAEETAAHIVRNTMPTYSLATSKAITTIRRAPIVGTFVSFPAEVVRNTYNTIDYAQREMKDPDTRNIGIKRMAGVMTALSFSTAASFATLALAGKDWEDLEDVRKFLPPWSRNSDILYIQDKGDGRGTYVDVGYSDPYNYLKKPVIAALRGDNLRDSGIEFLKEFSEPFIGEDLLASRIRDLTANKNKTTGEMIYNPALPMGDQTKQMMKYLWEGIKPGGVSSAERIAKSFKENQGKYGRDYDPVEEIVALFSGQRIATYNIPKSFYFRLRDFGDQYRNAVESYAKIRNREDVSDKDKQKAYETANESAKKIINKANEVYRAAIRQGAPVGTINKTINEMYSGSFPASKKLKNMIRTGYYQPIDRH